ncbi:hypothetical protein [Bacteroides thetaiotaomicron]|uniref:Uncharacterized protein n=1 Tax=Bacteroides thetaiotaomicron TaxID=818 RepID=A0A174UVV3_BACT4|nr:hypothetical protein [Bacteroides thetaiotaomicron]CUQ24058.1 Uncharacterised protein [Bacteroides thetaiotaomicron]
MRDQLMPSASDKLFISEASTENWLSTSKDTFFSYSEGYRLAGESLFGEIQENEYCYKRFLTYPMIFCYRQFIELRLKELIFLGRRIIDLSDEVKITHSISRLFEIYAIDILPNIDTNIDIKLFEVISRIINELENIDNNSMSFRYPVLKNLTPSITLPNMDINNFKIVMDRLSNFFDRQLEIMQYSENMKQEMIAELYSQLRSEYQSY